MKIQHNAYHLTKQVPVTERQRLGSVPHDAYVLNQPFQTNNAPEPQPLPTEKLEFDGGVPVYADNPVFDQAGKLQSVSQIHFVEAPRHGAVASGLSATAGSVLGSVVAGLIKAGPASLVVAAASALACFAGGTLSGARDQVSVVDKQVPVVKTELVGYRHHVLDGASVHDRPRNWPEGSGQLHYYLPDTKATEVGQLTTQEIEHSSLSPQALAGISFLSSLTSGLLLG